MEDAPPQANGHARVGSGTVAESPQPVVICGPSGVGKGTLIGKLMKEFPDRFGFSVSHTTRNPREKEQDGVHYHFTKRPVMEEEIEDGKFLESAEVHGNLYGTSWAAVNAVSEAGKICILDIDVQGAQLVKKSSLKALFIFIKPPFPEEEELEKRLRGRATESEDQIQKRLRNARQELERAKDVSLFDHILVNAKLDTAYEQLKALLGLGNPAASAHSNGTAKHLSEPGANPGRSASHVAINSGSVSNGLSASTVGAVFDHSDNGGGTPGSTRGLNGTVNGLNQSKPNGVSKHSKAAPHSYNHNLAILTPSDLLVSMHASAGSPRANGFSVS